MLSLVDFNPPSFSGLSLSVAFCCHSSSIPFSLCHSPLPSCRFSISSGERETSLSPRWKIDLFAATTTHFFLTDGQLWSVAVVPMAKQQRHRMLFFRYGANSRDCGGGFSTATVQSYTAGFMPLGVRFGRSESENTAATRELWLRCRKGDGFIAACQSNRARDDGLFDGGGKS